MNIIIRTISSMRVARVFGLLCCLFALLGITSCQEDTTLDVEQTEKSDIQRVTIRVNVSPRPMIDAVTRAESPLDPSTENFINSLRFFEFDQEGFHNRATDYHEVIFPEGRTSSGPINMQFSPLSRTIVCVANITPRNVEDLYNTYSGGETGQEEGRITLNDFKKWKIGIEYQQYTPNDPYEQAYFSSIYEGLPVSMPMASVFQGDPTEYQGKGITFYMGRLLTLLNFKLTFKSVIDKPIGAEFYNVVTQMHLFPGIRSEIEPDLPPRFQIVDILPRAASAYWGARDKYDVGESIGRYLYIAPTQATTTSNAVRADIFYGRACDLRFGNPGNEEKGIPPTAPVSRDTYVIPNARVYMTSNRLNTPGISNPFLLDDNTIYHIQLNVTVKDEESELTDPRKEPDSVTQPSRARTTEVYLDDKLPSNIKPDGTLVYDVTIHARPHD